MADFRHETERLILRDWREEDWEPFWQATNTPAVMEWLGGVCDDAKRDAAQQRLLTYQKDHGHTFWVVERKDDGVILGFCGLKRCTLEDGPLGEMEVGWRLREDSWGKGYAKEAALASLGLAFNRFDADQVVAITVRGNRPSWGLMERLGMEYRPELDFEDPSWSDEDPVLIVYSIARDQWEAAQ